MQLIIYCQHVLLSDLLLNLHTVEDKLAIKKLGTSTA